MPPQEHIQPPVQTPKGTRDFYPEDMRIQNHLFDGWRKTCHAFGYEEYEGPTFEHLELYVGKSGPEIVEQLYHFKDKGDRDLALRPELTPTLARMVNQKGNSLRLPIKWFSIPRLFRYERAQRGRLREFFQLNMDIIGCDTIAAEVDLISAVIEMLKGFGLGSNDFAVRISSRKLLSEFLDHLGIEAEKKPAVYTALDKRAKIGEEKFRVLLSEQGINTETANRLEAFFQCRSIEDIVSRVEGMNDPAGLSELKELFALLAQLGHGDFVCIDTSVVRGLAYYTGIVFAVFDKGQNLRAIAGGGRYDSLLSSLGGLAIPAVGFGMGDVVLADLLNGKGLLPIKRQGLDYYLADVASSEGLPRTELLSLAQRLRVKGRAVSYSLNGGKLKKQLAEANDQGVSRVLFLGSDRAPAGSYEMKDLTSGEQKMVGEEEL